MAATNLWTSRDSGRGRRPHTVDQVLLDQVLLDQVLLDQVLLDQILPALFKKSATAALQHWNTCVPVPK